MRVWGGVGGWVRGSVVAAALASGLLGARQAEAVTFTDADAGVDVDFTLPGAQICVLLPVSRRDSQGCEGLDVEALSAHIAGASATVVVRERDSTRMVLLIVSPRDRHSVARVEDAQHFISTLIDGVLFDGTRHLVGDPAAARAPTSLTVERGVQMARSSATVALTGGVASIAQATFFGRDVDVTLACTTPVADAAGASALLERLVAQTSVRPPEGELAWRPRLPVPQGPIVFHDAALGVTFDAQFPGSRVCVLQPRSLGTEAGCEDTDAAMAATLRRPELNFVARITDERGARVFTLKATQRTGNTGFYNEDVDEFDRALRRGLAGRARRFQSRDVGPARAVERGVQVVRDVLYLDGVPDAGAEGRALLSASFVGRGWIISLSLITINSDVPRSLADLDRVVHGAEVAAPTGRHVWESRDAAVGSHLGMAVGGVVKIVALCAALILAVRAFAKRRRA